MFASARRATIALMVLVAFVFTTARATAQAPDDQDGELPRTPPPVELSTAHDEPASAAQPSGSLGFALVAALLGPIGLALGGVTAASATSGFAPNSHPLSPPVGPDRPIH
jgi:hypothetical protein